MVNLITNIPNDIKLETSYNFITEIPQDIKLELNDGTLTLKAGSKIYIPNGTGVFDTFVTPNDIIIHTGKEGSMSTDYAIFIYEDGSEKLRIQCNQIVSSNTQPIKGSGDWWALWYDTGNNIFKISNDGGNTWETLETKLSFPVGVYVRTKGRATSIKFTFNGFGYIGHHTFVLPDVKGLIPNGTSNTSFTTSSVVVREMASGQAVTGIDRAIGIDSVWAGYKEVNTYSDADFTKTWIRYYVKNENKIYVYNGSSVLQVTNSVPLGFYDYDGASVIKFEVNSNPINGVLILKNGSILTRPNGIQVQTTDDFIFVLGSPTGQRIVMVSVNVLGSLGGFNGINGFNIFSGPSEPTTTASTSYWFDTTNNIIKRTTNTGSTWGVTSICMPVGLVTFNNGTTVSIDQVFNGFGYIGSAIFVLPKVRGIILEGRDIDGNAKFREIANNSLIIRNGYSGEYASLMSVNDNYYGIEFSEKPIYSEVANVFVGQPNITPFYYNFNIFDLIVEPKELNCSIIGLSQYANSPRFETLRKELVDIFNQVTTIQNFYDFVFNIKTASGYGLNVWGGILNQDRYFSHFNSSTNQYEVVYLNGGQTIDGVDYSDEEIENMYRLILFLKAMSYISNSSVAKLNEMLQFYFGDRGLAYVYEYGTMKIRYVFRFYISNLEKAIFESDIMPNPTGVLVDIEYLPKGAYFGFFVDGKTATNQPYSPMDQKPFYW